MSELNCASADPPRQRTVLRNHDAWPVVCIAVLDDGRVRVLEDTVERPLAELADRRFGDVPGDEVVRQVAACRDVDAALPRGWTAQLEVINRACSSISVHVPLDPVQRAADPAWLRWDHPLIDQLISDAKCVLGELVAALHAFTATAKAAAALADEDLHAQRRGLATHISEVSTKLEQLLQDVDECRHQGASPFKRVVSMHDLRVALGDAAAYLRMRMLRGEGS